MNPVVSVILLIGENSRSSVIKSINCLLKQTVGPIEIIAVNIGSEGHGVSISLQEDYADNRSITFLSLLDDITDNYRNYALRHANGNYVCFMSGGETWTEDKLEKQISVFGSEENVSAVVSNGVYTLNDGENVTSGSFFDSPCSDQPAQWMLRCPVITSGQVLYKRDAIIQIDKFDRSFYLLSDLDAICRISANGKVLLDCVQNVNCVITDNLSRKRRRFLEYEKLLFNRLYIDFMLSDRVRFNSYYHGLVWLALKAGYPIEVLQYSAIAFARFPIANTKFIISRIAKYIGSLICGVKNKILLKVYLKDIRRAAFGMRLGKPVHKYKIWRVKNGKGSDSLAYFSKKECSTIYDFQYAGSNLCVTFNVPYGTLKICEGAFAGCRELKRIVLPDTVTCIGARAFMDCDKLESVTCSSGSGLVKIDEYAFAGCSTLTEITLPNDLSYIGRGAFIGCTHLSRLTFLPSINANKTEAEFADRVSTIEPECFAGCHDLQTIRFGKASLLGRIGEYAFYNCYNLGLIWIESSLEVIGNHAFEGCKNVSEIVMPKMYMINSIGEYAFAGCQGLKRFTFPTNLAVVSEGLFKGCSSLSNCPIPQTVSKIRKYAFSDCPSLFSCVINNKHAKVSIKAFDAHTKVVYNKSEL